MARCGPPPPAAARSLAVAARVAALAVQSPDLAPVVVDAAALFTAT
jgi:hypothetical protein